MTRRQARPAARRAPRKAPGFELDTSGLGELAQAWTIGGPDYTGYRLLLVAKLLDRCAIQFFQREAGLTVAEWRVLIHTALYAPTTVRQLAELAWVDRAEVSRAATALVKRGLLRKVPNPADRRSPLLYCRPAGKRLWQKLTPARATFHRSLNEGLSARDHAAVERALHQFALKARGFLGED